MTCRKYRDSLLNLAASGDEPSGDLRAHLEVCPPCLRVLQQHRALFVSIDSSLHAVVNPEIPPTFLPRVRSLLNQQSIQPRMLVYAPGLTLAIVAVSIAIFVLVHISGPAKLPHQEQLHSDKQPAHEVVPTAPETAASPDLRAGPITHTLAQGRGKHLPVRHTQMTFPVIDRSPEIIVLADQEILLARYADRLRHRPASVLVVANESGSAQTEPLKVDLIQIAQLDVKPLAEQLNQNTPPENDATRFARRSDR